MGRLREITFREVGEGTNEAIDLDKYDQYYHHMFLWDDDAQMIAGAYRMGLGDVIYKKYGIEAARKMIISEIFGIIKATGNDNFNYNHIKLMVDNMVYNGLIIPINRFGFKRKNPGPISRMTFEQNTLQITNAALNSEIDILKHNPISCLIFGQQLPFGTGNKMDIYMDEKKIGIQTKDLDDIFN